MTSRWAYLLLIFLVLSSSMLIVTADDAEDDIAVSEEENSGIKVNTVNLDEAGADEAADEIEDKEDEFEDDILRPSKFIETSFIFPDFSDTDKLELDSVITLLVTVKNTAKHAFNITGVAAHFLAPFDHTYFIQNVTEKVLSSILEGGERATFEYKFMANPYLEPNEFFFEAFLNYHNANQDPFKSTIVSKSVHLVDKPTEFTAALVFNYVLSIGFAGVVIFLVARYFGVNKPAKKGPRSKQPVVERGTGGAAVDDGFFIPAKKSSVGRPVGRPGKGSNKSAPKKE